jgi:uncharacterized integral membrane protein
MRYVYIALIVLATAIVLVFKFQNLELVTLSFLTMSVTLPASVMVVLIYILGMFTGGSLLMLLRGWIKGSRKADRKTGSKPAA